MRRKEIFFCVLLVLVSGLFGGTVASWLILRNTPVRISAANGGNGLLYLVDREGRVRARFVVGKQGEPALGMADEAGNVRLTLGLGSHGEPGLNFLDTGGRMRARLRLAPDGAPDLALFDREGRAIFKAPSERP